MTNEKTLTNRWSQSLGELKKVRVIATCGIMMALAVALKFVASIDIGQYVRIGFSGIPNIVVSTLFGPAVGAVFWGALDVIKYILAPSGPFFPGFTLSAVVNGIIYALFLYKKPLTLGRAFLAEAVSKTVVSLGLNTLWLVLMYQQAFLVIFPARCITNVIMLPIDTIITYVSLQMVLKIWRQIGE